MSLNDALKVLKDHADAFRSKTGVTSKLDVVDMTHLLDGLKWGQTNLLKGTSDQYSHINIGGWGQAHTSDSSTVDISAYPVGTSFTYSATITNLENNTLCLEAQISGANPVHSNTVARGSKDQSIFVTVTKTDAKETSLKAWVICLNNAGNGTSVDIKDERLYQGIAPGFWTPNPADKVGGVNSLLYLLLLPSLEVIA